MSAPAEPSEELTGRMMVTASGPAAFVVVRDWTLTTKAAQRAPVNIAVAPGLYSVNVTRAGGGTQKYVGAVKAGEALTLVFRESAVEERRSSNVFARAAAGLSENLASLFGGTANLYSLRMPPNPN